MSLSLRCARVEREGSRTCAALLGEGVHEPRSPPPPPPPPGLPPIAPPPAPTPAIISTMTGAGRGGSSRPVSAATRTHAERAPPPPLPAEVRLAAAAPRLVAAPGMAAVSYERAVASCDSSSTTVLSSWRRCCRSASSTRRSSSSLGEVESKRSARSLGAPSGRARPPAASLGEAGPGFAFQPLLPPPAHRVNVTRVARRAALWTPPAAPGRRVCSARVQRLAAAAEAAAVARPR